MAKKKLETFVPGGGRVYAKLTADVAREMHRALGQEQRGQGVTKSKLAELVGRDKAFVTRSMSGGNLTLRTVAALFSALGYELEVAAHRIDAPPGSKTNGPRMAKVATEVTHSTATVLPAGFRPLIAEPSVY